MLYYLPLPSIYFLLLMYALCITLRIGNIMKIKQNEMIQRQKQNEQNQNDNTTTENEPKQ